MKDNLHIMQKIYYDLDNYSSRNGLAFNWNMKLFEEEVIIFFTIIRKHIKLSIIWK